MRDIDERRQQQREKVAYFIYSSSWSAWLPQYTKTSWTPALARNSRVYSITGVFARGRRHCAVSKYRYRYTLTEKNHSWTFEGKRFESRLKGIGKKLPSQCQCRGCDLCKARTDDGLQRIFPLIFLWLLFSLDSLGSLWRHIDRALCNFMTLDTCKVSDTKDEGNILCRSIFG